MADGSSYVAGVFGLAGVVLGFLGTNTVAWLEKHKRHRAYWSAISAEVELCKSMAETYLRDEVRAPLYRLPLIAYDKGFPALLGDGVVSKEAAKAILAFYSLVGEMNRGLEQANLLWQDRDAPDELLDTAANRIRIKAARISDHVHDAPERYYDGARSVIDANLRALGPGLRFLQPRP